MDSYELSRWMAYDQLDGVPDALWMCGRICQTVLGAFAGKKVSVEEIIGRERPVRVVSGDAAKAIMLGVTTTQRLKAERAKRMAGESPTRSESEDPS